MLMYNGEDDLLATLLRMPGANICARLPGMTGDGLLLELLNCLPSLSNSVLALLTHPHLEANTPDRKNETPLMKVIRHGHLPLAQALLARPDLRLADATDNEGRTLLIQMASKGDSAWVTAILCRFDCAISAGGQS
nr:ankyrin repeat domain-containing protein [Sodalis glossinidius]